MKPNEPAPLPDDWAEGTVESNGVALHYVRAGDRERPPLVVAHGVFDDGPCRTPLIRDLADDYDVVAYDARGHGRSDAPGTGYDVGYRVADLVGLVDALELESPILLGHSMGGDTVAATAARHPDLPRAVVLVDPGAMLERDGPREAGEVPDWVADNLDRWSEHTKAELLDADEELRGHAEAGEEELASLLADARVRVSPHVAGVFEHPPVTVEEIYPGIEAPTLVIKADADEAGRERDRERAAHLPEGRIVHVPGAGHCVFRDERETATRDLRAFLDGV